VDYDCCFWFLSLTSLPFPLLPVAKVSVRALPLVADSVEGQKMIHQRGELGYLYNNKHYADDGILYLVLTD